MSFLDEIYATLATISPSDDVPLEPGTVLKSPTLSGPIEMKNENDELVEKYLTPSDQLSWSLLNEFENMPETSKAKKEQINFSLIGTPNLLNRTTIRFKRAGIDGSIVSFAEEILPDALEASNAASSLSLNRKYSGYSKLNVKGSTASLPFLPGGLNSSNTEAADRRNDATKTLHRDQYGLFDIPKGFSRGLAENKHPTDSALLDRYSALVENPNEIELSNDLEVDLAEDEEPETGAAQLNNNEPADAENHTGVKTLDNNLENEILNFIPKNTLIRPSAANSLLYQQQKRKSNWAHVVDLNHKIENFDELIPNPARTWPFELDIFQQEAVYHLEQGDSVFVAAHTSAGKTVVAEYAIAMAHKNMTKAIYTSPIKALSNQKFRDFRHTFKDIDVGVITGDVQINPDANCLIMTTEILRSMLYRGSDVIRDVEFVIFDEVHYVNDVDRGVVWEEVIIMLPDHVKIILLSATVPNTLEFASWVGRTKQKDIYVISTPKRPVPLEIFLFAKDTPYKIIDSNRNFLETGYNRHADKFLKTKPKESEVAGRGGARGGACGGARGGARGRGGSRGGRSNNNSGPRFIKRDAPTSKSWITLVDYLRKNDLLPAVIFVFSKKRCEEYAETLSGFNFLTAKESSEVHMFMDKAVSRLKKEDRELPQILRMREMLKRGIAVHHGGLLPIIKEVVEILFSKSLIKVLFATETFAMGLNLPTRTVVFSSVRKHDGTGFRDLLPGEFTQMSGRAGRRGLDKIGTVMIMAYQQPVDKSSIKQVALGMPTKLSSQFRLTYTMILNLLRIEALKVEDMIKRSFGENTSQSMLPDQQLEIVKLQNEVDNFQKLNIETDDLLKLETIYDFFSKIADMRYELNESFAKGPNGKKVFKNGRLIVYRNEKNVSMVGILINTNIYKNSVDCISACLPIKDFNSEIEHTNLFFNPAFGEQFIEKWIAQWKVTKLKKVRVVRVTLDSIDFISNENIKITTDILHRDKASLDLLSEKLTILLDRRIAWNSLDYPNLMNENNIENVSNYMKYISELSDLLNDEGIIDLMQRDGNYIKVSQKMGLMKRIDMIKQSLNDENLELLPEYNKRLNVLKTLGYIDSEQLTVNLKGRVACEINCGWELFMTELVFDNFLGGFSSEEIVALLSCFVYDGKKGDDDAQTKLSTPRLEKGKEKICSIVEKVMELSVEVGIQLTAEEEAFLENDRFALVNTVYEWARGRSFREIMEYANDAEESEGTIVRVITFLDEICNQVKNAALITGDSALHSKMTDAQEKIKRDIVFCASLYL